MRKITHITLATIIFGTIASLVAKYISFEVSVLMMLVCIYVEILFGDE